MVPPPERGEDPELDLVTDWFNSQGHLEESFGSCIRVALDEVIDTPRTARWDIAVCNKQEQAYVGVKIEHVIRAHFDLPPGQKKMDYCIDGVDIDCKWSRKWGAWQIPKQAVGHICLLVWGSDAYQECATGLIRIREEILVGGNQDKKRSIQSPEGRDEVRWLVPRGSSLPENFIFHLDPADRQAILSQRGGDARARELFIRCEGVLITRHTIASIGQQLDEARRFRGETRHRLLEMGFEVLNGHRKEQRKRAEALGGPVPQRSSEWVCLRSDGSTPRRLAAKIAQRQEAAKNAKKARKRRRPNTESALLTVEQAANQSPPQA